MSSKFSRRVEVERKVLSLVNQHYTSKQQLAGLSPKAIDQWKLTANPSTSEEVERILRNLDKLSMHLSRSGQTLETLESDAIQKIDLELGKLTALLTN